MPIRNARFTELNTIASILAAAFWDEDAIGRFMHPYREEYPQDFQEWWKRKLREHWWDYRLSLLVSTNENDNVTGVAEWVAHGTSAGKLNLRRWDPRSLLKPTVALYNRLCNIIWPNRAADPTTIHSYELATPFFIHHWTGSRANNWQLETLAVHPDHQGQGYGSQLVAWGLKKASEERVAASVVSSHGKESFYMKCGFNKPGIVGNVCDGEENPLKGVKGGMILFRDSEY